MLRRGARCALALATAAACSSNTILPIPKQAGIAQWILVAHEGDALRARALSPDDALRFELTEEEALTIEALGFDAPIVAPGDVVLGSSGDLLPEPDAVLVADVSLGAWASRSEPDARTAALRLPRRDDCLRLSVTNERLSEGIGQVYTMLELEPGWRLLTTHSGWFKVDAQRTEPFPELVPRALAGTIDASGVPYLATPTQMWRLERSGATWTATVAWTFPEELDLFSLAAPRPGVFYALDERGRLFRMTSTETRVAHQFEFTTMRHQRASVIADGEGVLAGAGTDPSFLEIDAQDRIRVHTIPDPAEGAASIVKTSRLGIVVGTGQGILRAERDGFEPLPDPLGHMPRGTQIRGIAEIGDRIFYGGNSGLIGEISPMETLCTSEQKASAVLRAFSRIDDVILAVGGTIDIDRHPNVARFAIVP